MGHAPIDGAGPFFIDIRDVQSGQQIFNLTLPPISEDQTKTYYSLSRHLSYCDGGKYLVAFTPPDRLYVPIRVISNCMI